MGRTGRWAAAVALGGAAVIGAWTWAPAEAITGVTVTSTTLVGGLTTPEVVVTVPTTLPVATTLPTLTTTVTVPTTVAVPGVTDPITVPTVPTVPTLPVPLPTTLPGVTIPTLPGAGAVVGKVTGCASFVTQQAAQAALLADPSLAALLDSDHDGAACELLPTLAGAPAPAGGSAPSGNGAGTVSASGLTGSSSTGPGAGPSSGGATSSLSGGTAGDGTTAAGGTTGARSGGGRRGSSTATGRPSISVGGSTLAANDRPLGDADGEDGDDHLALTILAFVLLLGSAAGTAREVAAGRAGTAGDAPSAVA
jgi:hypothetical protein